MDTYYRISGRKHPAVCEGTAHTHTGRIIRAGMLTVSDLKNGIRGIWPTAAVMTVLYIGYWAVLLATGKPAGPEDRVPVLYLAALFFSFSVPATVYGHINDPSDGIGYIMLPLPAWVKFGVMMLVATVFLPLGYYLAVYMADCVLALAGGGKGFSGMIWEADGTGLTGFLSDFIKICLYQSVFILGNICLRRHKIALTILAMLAVHGIFIGAFHIEEIRGGILYMLYSYIAPVSIWIVSFMIFKHMQLR